MQAVSQAGRVHLKGVTFATSGATSNTLLLLQEFAPREQSGAAGHPTVFWSWSLQCETYEGCDLGGLYLL